MIFGVHWSNWLKATARAGAVIVVVVAVALLITFSPKWFFGIMFASLFAAWVAVEARALQRRDDHSDEVDEADKAEGDA